MNNENRICLMDRARLRASGFVGAALRTVFSGMRELIRGGVRLQYIPAPSPPYPGERVGVRGHSREPRNSTNRPYPSPPSTRERGPEGPYGSGKACQFAFFNLHFSIFNVCSSGKTLKIKKCKLKIVNWSKRLSALCALHFALCLAGCTVGPDYHPPRTEVPAHWVNRGMPATTQNSPATTQSSTTTQRPILAVRWWRSFNDPALDALIARAVEANLDLQQARERLYEARATRGVVGAALLPDVNANGQYTRSGSGKGN